MVAAVSHSREYFLRLTLLLGSVLYAATALGAGRAAGAICGTDPRQRSVLAAVVAASTLLLNVPVQLSNLAGKENALYGALLVAFVNLHLDRRVRHRPWFPILCGVVAGLILLTRVTPMSLAVVAVQPLTVRGRDRRLSYAGKYAIAAFGILLPWMAYAELTFRSMFPFSDQLNAHAAWTMLASDNRPALSMFARVIGEYYISCGRFAFGLEKGQLRRHIRDWQDIERQARLDHRAESRAKWREMRTESTFNSAVRHIAIPIVQACTRRSYHPDTRSIVLLNQISICWCSCSNTVSSF